MKRLRLKNIHTAPANQRTMAHTRYFGFAIGAYSHHREIQIDLDGQIYIVTRGSPLVLQDSFNGSPIVSPVRRLALQTDALSSDDIYDAYQSRAEILGFQSSCELGYPLPRAEALVHRFALPNGPVVAKQALIVPWDGRESGLFTLVADNEIGSVTSFEIYGGTNQAVNLIDDAGSPFAVQSADSETSTALYTGTTDDTQHVLVQDVEPYDVLTIWILSISAHLEMRIH